METKPGIKAWRNHQVQRMRKLVDSATGLRFALDDRRSPAARVASPARSPSAVAVLSAGMSWPDRALPVMLRDGAAVVGDMPPSGVFREADVRAVMSLDALLDTSEGWISGSKGRQPPIPGDAETIWDKRPRGVISAPSGPV